MSLILRQETHVIKDTNDRDELHPVYVAFRGGVEVGRGKTADEAIKNARRPA